MIVPKGGGGPDDTATANSDAGEGSADGTGEGGGGDDTNAGGDGGADTAAGSDGGDTAYVTLTGRVHFVGAYNPDPDIDLCNTYWDLSATGPSSMADACPDCTWTFDVSWTYDAAASFETVSFCYGSEGPNYTWPMALVEDYDGYGDMVMSGYEGSWVPMWGATWDGSSLTFGYGEYDTVYPYGGTIYYYTRFWYGTAEVE